MTFNSLNQILNALPIVDRSPEQQQFLLIYQSWPALVGEKVNLHTRPLSLSQGVLKIACESSAWAQTLTLQRYQILKHLDSRFSLNLKDLHFSTAHWETSLAKAKELETTEIWEKHPSRLPPELVAHTLPKKDRDALSCPEIVSEILDNLAKRGAERSKFLPLCPECHAPTPPGEIERWSVCALCVHKSGSIAQTDQTEN